MAARSTDDFAAQVNKLIEKSKDGMFLGNLKINAEETLRDEGITDPRIVNYILTIVRAYTQEPVGEKELLGEGKHVKGGAAFWPI